MAGGHRGGRIEVVRIRQLEEPSCTYGAGASRVNGASSLYAWRSRDEPINGNAANGQEDAGFRQAERSRSRRCG
jgi:hypothetical protein